MLTKTYYLISKNFEHSIAVERRIKAISNGSFAYIALTTYM